MTGFTVFYNNLIMTFRLIIRACNINGFILHILQEAMYHKSLSVTATQNMMSSSYFAGSTPLTKHLILPTSAQGRITLNRSPNPLKIADGPRVNVDLQINDVPIILSESQFNQLVKLSDAFKLRMISQKYHHLRPKDTIKKK